MVMHSSRALRKPADERTHCRNPREYFRIFDSIEMQEKDGSYSHFELLSCKPVDAYCRIKKNQNQVPILTHAKVFNVTLHPDEHVVGRSSSFC